MLRICTSGSEIYFLINKFTVGEYRIMEYRCLYSCEKNGRKIKVMGPVRSDEETKDLMTEQAERISRIVGSQAFTPETPDTSSANSLPEEDTPLSGGQP